jgi:hypothetical protein
MGPITVAVFKSTGYVSYNILVPEEVVKQSDF